MATDSGPYRHLYYQCIQEKQNKYKFIQYLHEEFKPLMRQKKIYMLVASDPTNPIFHPTLEFFFC